MSIKKILLAIGMLAVLCTALCACGEKVRQRSLP